MTQDNTSRQSAVPASEAVPKGQRKTLRIQGYTFTIPQPFGPGHPLSEGEAQALNGLFSENISNNLRDEVKKVVELLGPGEVLSAEAEAQLQAKFDTYSANYQFLVKHVSRHAKGIIEAEAMALAEEKLAAEMQGQPPLGLEETLSRVAMYSQLPAIREAARERAGAKSRALVGASLEELL